MAFVEVQFPADISYGSGGGPEYFTDIVETHGGYEQRNANWSAARARYNVAHGVKSKEQLDALIAFFRARKGRAEGFRFKDWTDFQATNELLGAGNGVTAAFQLVRRYISGGITEMRTVHKPVAGSVAVYLNGVLQSAGFSISTSTGMVTFTTPPGSGVLITADCEFDVPVRFDTDRLSATLDAYGSHSWRDIPLVEVRL